MASDEINQKAARERLEQLKTVRAQVKRALEEVEEKPKSEHGQETINRLREQLEKINNDLLATKRAAGDGAKNEIDLEMMDVMLESKKDNNDSK